MYEPQPVSFMDQLHSFLIFRSSSVSFPFGPPPPIHFCRGTKKKLPRFFTAFYFMFVRGSHLIIASKLNKRKQTKMIKLSFTMARHFHFTWTALFVVQHIHVSHPLVKIKGAALALHSISFEQNLQTHWILWNSNPVGLYTDKKSNDKCKKEMMCKKWKKTRHWNENKFEAHGNSTSVKKTNKKSTSCCTWKETRS